jgi:hypothetical protein
MREKPRSREQECRRAQARQPLARQRSAFRPQWETARRPSPEPRPKEWNLQALAGLREPADSACLQAVRRQFETYDVLTENRGVAGSIPALATSRNGCKALTSIAGASERRPAPTGRVGLFRPFQLQSSAQLRLVERRSGRRRFRLGATDPNRQPRVASGGAPPQRPALAHGSPSRRAVARAVRLAPRRQRTALHLRPLQRARLWRCRRGRGGRRTVRGRVPERGAAGDHRPHGQARRKVALAERALSSPLAQACRGDGPDT